MLRYSVRMNGARVYLDLDYSRSLTGDNLIYLEKGTSGEYCCGREITECCSYAGSWGEGADVSNLVVECADCGEIYPIKVTESKS